MTTVRGYASLSCHVLGASRWETITDVLCLFQKVGRTRNATDWTRKKPLVAMMGCNLLLVGGLCLLATWHLADCCELNPAYS